MYIYIYIHVSYMYTCCGQLLSCVQLFADPRIAAHQASLSFTISQSLLKLIPIKLVLPLTSSLSLSLSQH